MKISIITPTYNSEAFVRDCIESVLNQSFSSFEHIVVDGCSMDKTIEIARSFEHLKIISEPDHGIYDAINKGISIANGDIVGVLNSDDVLADLDVFKRIVECFDRDSDLEAVYSDLVYISNKDIRKIVRFYSSKRFRPWQFRFGFQPAHPTFYVKRSLFNRLGPYRVDLAIAGDFELLLRFLSNNAIKSTYVNDIWVKMRLGGVSTSGLGSTIKLNKEIVEACNSNGIYTNSLLVYLKYFVKWSSFIVNSKKVK